MNYDLAKELKEAGFPQGGNGGWTGSKEKIVWRSGHLVYVPTLTELIDACGHQLFFLCDKDDSLAVHHINGTKFQGAGTTPQEAVARLWLAIQKATYE
jgi:hypothetical protein